MSTSTTGQQRVVTGIRGRMGVASLSSKRRLEASDTNPEYPTSPKLSKKFIFSDSDLQDSILQNGHERCSSEFLTTSILARTLLTASNNNCNNNVHSSSPLESLKSSLEALPAPTFLESIEELHSNASFLSSLPKITTIRSEETTDLEFDGLLCHERSLSKVTVLSPIDETLDQSSTDWNSGILPMKNPSLTTMAVNDQLITEDENGKSYFNLGPSEATVLAKKSRSSSSSTSSNTSNSPPDQTWLVNSNNMDYLDDTSSSSSCESISSEDLFNSCEEYDDGSEDEEEVRSYKQERSTVLHLSLCKLNSFRTQQCVEPSLHRSVLICNTLRHIEQEIRHEDEMKKHQESSFLQSRETLPSFWPSNSRNGVQNPVSNGLSTSHVLPPLSSPSHDPYLSSSLYNDSPYSTVSNTAAYDYNSPHRPSQTPFHTTSYDYPETDLSNQSSHSQQSPIMLGDLVTNSPTPSLLECDSGYAEDMDLSMSSYYYSSSQSEYSVSPLGPTSAVPVIPIENCYLPCSPETVGGYNTPNIPLMTTDPNGLNNTPLAIAGGILSSRALEPLEKLQNAKCSDKNRNLLVVSVESDSLGSNSSSNISSKYLENSSRSSCSGSTILPFTESLDCWSKFTSSQSSPPITPFAQQESQCGIESLRSDFSLGSTNGHSIHHHIPMDTLVSSNYSTT